MAKAAKKKPARQAAPAPSRIAGQVKNLPIDSIKPHPNNPRKGNVSLIQESIKEIGWYGRIIVQASTGRILIGEHRWRAAKASGLKTIPAEVIDVDDDLAEKILLVDNRSSDGSTYDDVILLDILGERTEKVGGLSGTGYTRDDVELLREVAEYQAKKKAVSFEVDPKKLLKDNHHTCPRCGFEFE